jgi:hypothetical protein
MIIRKKQKVDEQEWRLAIGVLSKPSALQTLQSQKIYAEDSILNLEKNIDQYDKYIEKCQSDIKLQVMKVKETLKQIEITKNASPTTYLRVMKIAMEQVAQSKRVDWLFLTEKGEIVVQTKMLFAFDARKDKMTKNEVGHFALYFNLVNQTWAVQQMDFEWDDKYNHGIIRHPNFGQQQTTCWGINEGEIRGMLRVGNLHGAVEGLINFVSYFPQDGHDPRIYMSWLKKKKLKLLPNPWEKLVPIFEIGRAKRRKK